MYIQTEQEWHNSLVPWIPSWQRRPPTWAHCHHHTMHTVDEWVIAIYADMAECHTHFTYILVTRWLHKVYGQKFAAITNSVESQRVYKISIFIYHIKHPPDCRLPNDQYNLQCTLTALIARNVYAASPMATPNIYLQYSSLQYIIHLL